MELLVTIAVIATLMTLLVPSLSRARDVARSITCVANMRSVGTAMLAYVTDNDQTFPLAYVYKGMRIQNGVQTPALANQGIIHWTAVLAKDGRLDRRVFMCPGMAEGGLPAANPAGADRLPGQINLVPGVIDEQVPRCAYGVNEAICPRNRSVYGFDNATTISQAVRISRIENPSQVILAAEMTPNWRLVHLPGVSAGICQSYLPVNGFAGLGPMGPDRYDLNMIGKPHPCFGDYRRLTAYDLSLDSEVWAYSRLDWVGRNHDRTGNLNNDSKTNFVYVDGHVETMTIRKTLDPFQWGEVCYSIVGRTIAP